MIFIIFQAHPALYFRDIHRERSDAMILDVFFLTIMLDIERTVLAAGTELAFRQGECLYRKAQQPDYVFYLKFGSVALSGDESSPPRCVEDEACFLGLSELLLGHPHQETAIVQGTSELLAFERSVLESLMDRHGGVRRYFMRKLCANLHQARDGFE